MYEIIGRQVWFHCGTSSFLHVEDTAGVLFQRDQTLSTREVGDAVHEMSQYLDQSAIVLEYVSRNWL